MSKNKKKYEKQRKLMFCILNFGSEIDLCYYKSDSQVIVLDVSYIKPKFTCWFKSDKFLIFNTSISHFIS